MPLTDDPWLPYNLDGTVPPVRLCAPVAVYRYDGVSTLTALPNVECLSVAQREGTDPGAARFRYNLASGLDGAPVSIEQALGTGFTGTYVIEPGDRLVVQATRPDSTVECLFDGLALNFGMGLDPEIEEVMIGAVGIAWHCWDSVIPGALQRKAGAARTIVDTQTAIPAQFNPGGLPNCTPDGYMAGMIVGGMDFKYPTFLDPTVIQTPDNRTYWTLAKACRYILFNMNPAQTYVLNPDGGALDSLLVSPSAYGDTSAPILCPDTPITHKDWPNTINRLVGELGFGTNFALTTSGAGLPVTSFNIFANQSGTQKSLYLAPRGTAFDARYFNFNSSRLNRDLTEVVNKQTVVGGPHLWEASFILAPGFPMQPSDATPANLPSFDTNNPAYLTTNRNKYRLYIFDETSDGHYAVGTTALISVSPSLDGLFGMGLYCHRRRPGIGTLISVDPATNRKFEARLSISTDYAGSKPGLWDGTGTWQAIATTTWRLLPDRLGIEITDSNPNRWEIGASKNAGDPFPLGTVNGVEDQAAYASISNFYLRLTCVVEADQCLTQIASPLGNSPLSQTIARVTDASDRFHNEYIDYPSEFNATGGSDLNPRDDNANALAEAQALRAQTEVGVLEGPVTIPRLTTYYQIGDLITQIEGRNLGLRTDQGTGTPIYPVVVGITYDLVGGQSTTLELSDAGTVRRRYVRAPGRVAQAGPKKSHETTMSGVPSTQQSGGTFGIPAGTSQQSGGTFGIPAGTSPLS